MTTSTNEEIFRKLAEPFPEEEIEWRIGSTTKDKSKGLALAYLTARAVMSRLDEVIGPEWWSESVRFEGGAWVCRLKITLPKGEEVIHEDGAGPTDIEAAKGGISGSLKRVVVKIGIGRYLYYLPPMWVPIRLVGKSYVIDGNPPSLPEWALPGGSGRPEKLYPATPPRRPKGSGEGPKSSPGAPQRADSEEPPPETGHGAYQRARADFVRNTEAMTAEDAGYWKAGGPNDHIRPALVPRNGSEPVWFNELHNGPFSNPLKGCSLQKPIQYMSWREFSQGSPDGRRMQFLLWEIEEFAPPTPRPPYKTVKQEWMDAHNIRISRAKATVIYAMAKAMSSDNYETDNAFNSDDDPDRGRDERGADPGEQYDPGDYNPDDDVPF